MQEIILTKRKNGMAAMLLIILLYGAAIVGCIFGSMALDTGSAGGFHVSNTANASPALLGRTNGSVDAGRESSSTQRPSTPTSPGAARPRTEAARHEPSHAAS